MSGCDPHPCSGLIVGVLGGMGPAATADFYTKLVVSTPAKTDQEHLAVVIWADPMVPDRTEALLNGGEDPTPWLINGAKVLRDAGATIIVVPCNTAHAFLTPVIAAVDVPFLHMIAETSNRIAQLKPTVRVVGLLSTTGTQASRLYQDSLAKEEIDVITPNSVEQESLVMAAIKAIKAGENGPQATHLLARAAQKLVTCGAQAILAGCTEIPLALRDVRFAVPIVDPTQVLVDAVIAKGYVPLFIKLSLIH